HIVISVHVPDLRALRLVHEKGLPAHRAKRPYRRVYTSRNILQRFGEELFGLGAFQAHYLPPYMSINDPLSQHTTTPVPMLCRWNQPCFVSMTNWILSVAAVTLFVFSGCRS